ncbi:MAG: S8 family serine peptidase [Bacillota bacterium]|jgi:subtilisin family serine protease
MVILGFARSVTSPWIIDSLETQGLHILYKAAFLPILSVEANSLEALKAFPFITRAYEARVGSFSWIEDFPVSPKLLQRRFLKGVGVRVGIIDSGLGRRSTSFEDAIAATKDFTGNGMNDQVGHGTYVAEIIHQYAPEAKLYVAKVGDRRPHELFILEALEWCALNNVNVINISAGIEATKGCDGSCAICSAITALRNRGIVVTVAAGNRGPGIGTIDCPGNSPDAITVGAYDRKRRAIADYSSRGREDQKKPDLVCGLPKIFGDRGKQLEGTSFASPVIAGIIAACMTHYDGENIQRCLMDTAHDLGFPRHIQGAGCLDLERALGELTNGRQVAGANQ